MSATLDVYTIIQSLGGPTVISRRLEAENIAIRSPQAVAAWARRESLPIHGLAELMVLSQRLGTPLDVYAFLLTESLGGPPDGKGVQPRFSPAW